MPIIGNSSPLEMQSPEMSHRRDRASLAARSGTPPPGARYGAGPNKEGERSSGTPPPGARYGAVPNKEGERSDRSPPPQLSPPPSTRARTPPPGGMMVAGGVVAGGRVAGGMAAGGMVPSPPKLRPEQRAPIASSRAPIATAPSAAPATSARRVGSPSPSARAQDGARAPSPSARAGARAAIKERPAKKGNAEHAPPELSVAARALLAEVEAERRAGRSHAEVEVLPPPPPVPAPGDRGAAWNELSAAGWAMLNELRGGVEAQSTPPQPPQPPQPQPPQPPQQQKQQQQRSPPPRSPMLALSTTLEPGFQIREEDEPGFPFATREKISWGPISEQSRSAVLSAALSEHALVTDPVAEAEAVLVDCH